MGLRVKGLAVIQRITAHGGRRAGAGEAVVQVVSYGDFKPLLMNFDERVKRSELGYG